MIALGLHLPKIGDGLFLLTLPVGLRSLLRHSAATERFLLFTFLNLSFIMKFQEIVHKLHFQLNILCPVLLVPLSKEEAANVWTELIE